jgi:hypothetical protein
LAVLAVLALAGCGETPNSDPFDLPSGPTHHDLIRAAKAAGFKECSDVNDQGMTTCSTGPPGSDTESVVIVDDNEDLATSEYERTCATRKPTDPAYDVWYDGSDWVFFVISEFTGPDDVNKISSKLGDPQDCRT